MAFSWTIFCRVIPVQSQQSHCSCHTFHPHRAFLVFMHIITIERYGLWIAEWKSVLTQPLWFFYVYLTRLPKMRTKQSTKIGIMNNVRPTKWKKILTTEITAKRAHRICIRFIKCNAFAAIIHSIFQINYDIFAWMGLKMLEYGRWLSTRSYTQPFAEMLVLTSLYNSMDPKIRFYSLAAIFIRKISLFSIACFWPIFFYSIWTKIKEQKTKFIIFQCEICHRFYRFKWSKFHSFDRSHSVGWFEYKFHNLFARSLIGKTMGYVITLLMR